MKFSVLILTIGIPSSGKTSWVQEYKKTHPLTYIISTDEIRRELTGTEVCKDPSQNDFIHSEARRRVTQILNDPNSLGGIGPEIIVDSTNVDVEEWLEYKNLGASVILAKIFDIAVEKAIQNQTFRERKVPHEIIIKKWETFQRNKKFLPYIFNMLL